MLAGPGLRFVAAAVLVASLPASPARSQGVGDVLSRISSYVARYYERAQSLVAEETVILQPLLRDLSFNGFPRRLQYELRVEWDPSGNAQDPATVVRELVSARGPLLGPPDQPDCLDPRAVSPEPLMFLLPDRREKFTFTLERRARVNGRSAVVVEYRSRKRERPQVDWRKDCASFELPGHTRGRIWADADTWEVLRLDEHLQGPVEIPGPPPRRGRIGPSYFTVERNDTTIHYEPVHFADPDEVIMLPARVESLSVIPGSGQPRMRVTQTFGNFRRFVTESRIVQ